VETYGEPLAVSAALRMYREEGLLKAGGEGRGEVKVDSRVAEDECTARNPDNENENELTKAR